MGWTLGWTLVGRCDGRLDERWLDGGMDAGMDGSWTLGGRYPKILERDGHGRCTGRSPKVDGMRSKSQDLLYGYG